MKFLDANTLLRCEQMTYTHVGSNKEEQYMLFGNMWSGQQKKERKLGKFSVVFLAIFCSTTCCQSKNSSGHCLKQLWPSSELLDHPTVGWMVAGTFLSGEEFLPLLLHFGCLVLNQYVSFWGVNLFASPTNVICSVGSHWSPLCPSGCNFHFRFQSYFYLAYKNESEYNS